MDKNILIVIDDSGSMESIISTIIEKCEELVDAHKDSNFIFWKFGSSDKISKISLSEVKKLSATSGMTALYKAASLAIDDLGEMYTKNKLNPNSKTIVFILTDGQDNDSGKYTQQTLDEKMKHQKEKYGWDFHFFGSDLRQTRTANTMNFSSSNEFEASTRGVQSMFVSISKSIGSTVS